MSVSDAYTRGLLKELRASGALTDPRGVDGDTAARLLRTPPTGDLLSSGGGTSPAAAGSMVAAAATANNSSVRRRSVQMVAAGGGTSIAARGGGGGVSRTLSLQAETAPVAEVMGRLEEGCQRFHPTLAASTTLAAEQMQRSLLQLFEDTVREKVVDIIVKKASITTTFGGPMGGGGGGGGGVGESSFMSHTSVASSGGASGGGIVASPIRGGGGAEPPLSPLSQYGLSTGAGSPAAGSAGAAVVSRRPVDRGLDRRDRALTAFVLPDALRAQLAADVALVVETELKRCIGAVGSEVDGIFRHVVDAKGRMLRLEEDLLQRHVEGRMQAEQIAQHSGTVAALNVELDELRGYLNAKDTQADVLRDQITRRGQSLDEARVRFRREVLRYKQRIFELETEMEGLLHGSGGSGGGSSAFHHSVSGGGGTANTTGGGFAHAITAAAAGRRRRTSVAIMNDINALANPPGGAEEEAAQVQEELAAVAEAAVREVTDRLEEQHRRREVQLLRERKALQQEMAARLGERENEILRLKEKLRSSASGGREDAFDD